jgi:hypothetical protein
MDRTANWIKKSLIMGRFRLSLHASERSEERLVTENDIRHCGRTAKSVKFQELRGTWRVIGLDVDGELLNVICSVQGQLLIVTVY